MESKAPETVAAKSKRRRLWPKLLVFALFVGLGSLLCAWFLAPGLIASRIEAELEKSLAVDATVTGVSLSIKGGADIESIRLVDLEGREVVNLGDIQAQTSLGSLIKGELQGEATLGVARLQLIQEQDGTWNLESLSRAGKGGATEGQPESAPQGQGSGGLPDLDFTFRAPAIDVQLTWEDGSSDRVRLDLAAVLRGGQAAELERLKVNSSFLKGTLEGGVENLSQWLADPTNPLRLRGVKAELTYIPDELQRVLTHFAEVELEGAEEEPLTLEAQGDLAELTPEGLLRDIEAQLEAGVGRLTVLDFTAQGKVRAQLGGGRLTLTSDLGLNGGAFDLEADLDAAGLLSETGARDTTFSVGLADVGIGAELAPLLAALHPMLAANQALAKGGLDGTVDARVSFSVEAPLILAQLQEDPDSFPLNALSAEGSLGLAAALSDLPLVGELSQALGVDLKDGAVLKPFAFSIRDGRVGYDKPWTWTIDGLPTSFTGSVGLDRSLDLVWRVPITERLANKSTLLQRLSGKDLAIPMGGTLLDPKLDLAGALQGVAGDALRETLEDELLDQLEGIGLDDLTGGGDLGGALDQLENQLGLGGDSDSNAKSGELNDPVKLFAEANRLWKAGDRAAAQPLYRRIEKEFRLSPTYLLNKKRIKKRADWKPD